MACSRVRFTFAFTFHFSVHTETSGQHPKLDHVRFLSGQSLPVVQLRAKYFTHMNFNRLQSFNVNKKNPTDATVSRYLFTAKLLYMFRLSQHPSSGVTKTVHATSSTGCGYSL